MVGLHPDPAVVAGDRGLTEAESRLPGRGLERGCRVRLDRVDRAHHRAIAPDQLEVEANVAAGPDAVTDLAFAHSRLGDLPTPVRAPELDDRSSRLDREPRQAP